MKGGIIYKTKTKLTLFNSGKARPHKARIQQGKQDLLPVLFMFNFE
jgi:hypothetical protein